MCLKNTHYIPGANPCDDNNGGCTDICYPASGGGVECSCPDNVNMKLGNNGKMCIPVVNDCANLNPRLFVCANGRCISAQRSCDGDDDCGDSSDENEQYCAKRTCPAFLFVCGNGRCIAPHWRCDHDNDCGDGSDELDCAFPTCGANQFMCGNSRCIDITEVRFIVAASLLRHRVRAYMSRQSLPCLLFCNAF